jgi:hypothetical protein
VFMYSPLFFHSFCLKKEEGAPRYLLKSVFYLVWSWDTSENGRCQTQLRCNEQSLSETFRQLRCTEVVYEVNQILRKNGKEVFVQIYTRTLIHTTPQEPNLAIQNHVSQSEGEILHEKLNRTSWPCRSSSGWSLASHRGGPGSRPGSMWGLWWTKRQWGRFSPSTSVSPANHSTNFSIIIITRGWHNRPIGGRNAVWSLVSPPPPPPTIPINLERTSLYFG